jgi:L-alanine-DL-glutamate epimerase-like enolase superfamily enzyme
MQITSIDYMRIFVPWKPSYRQAMGRWRAMAGTTPEEEDAFVVIRVHTDQGITGLGEGGRSVSEVRTKGERFIGQNPMAMNLFDLQSPFLHAMVDIAGKALDVPACMVLGGKYRDAVPLAFWSPYLSPEETGKHAEEGAKAGFKVHKIKARPWDVIEQVKAITAAGGADYAVRIDPNELFELPAETVRIDRALVDYNVECFEDPVPKSRPEWYALLRKKCFAPLAIHTRDTQRIMEIARHDGTDYVNVGGSPRQISAAASVAGAAGCPVWVQHEAHCLDVTAAFTVHQAAALPNATRPADMLVFLRDGHIAKEPLQIGEGKAAVPDRPGLGVELDERMIEKYRVG